MRLSTKIFLTIGLTLLVAIVATGWSTYRSSRVTTQALISQHQSELARLTMSEIDQLLYRYTLNIQTVAGTVSFQNYLSAADGDLKKLNERLQEFQILNGPWNVLFVVDANGTIVLSTDRVRQGDSVSADQVMADAFAQAKQRSTTSTDVFMDEEYGYPTMLFSAPIVIKETNTFVGAVVGYSTWPALTEILARVPSNAHMYDQQGLLIASNQLIDRSILFQRSYKDTEIIKQALRARQGSLIEKAIDHNTNSKTPATDQETLISYVSQQGFLQYHGNNWLLTVETPTKAAFLPVTQNALTLTIILASTISLGALLIILLIYWLVIRPIDGLTFITKQIAAGNFKSRAQVSSNDEVGQLAGSFNVMTEKLQLSYQQLENRVNERTREITKKSSALEQQQSAILNVLADVEAEKSKTKALAKDLEKFKLAVDNASDHVVVTDADGLVLYGNRAMEKITGYTAKEALGTKAGVLWRKPMGQKYYENLWTTIKSKKQIFESVITNVRKGGEEYQAQISISPIMDKKGNIIYFVGLERDITKEKQIDKAKTEFVSLASHQLRTPLTAVNWYTEMLLNGDAGKVSATQKNYLDEIYSGNQRMVTLVNMLLNVSRLELGTFTVEPQPTVLSELADDVLKELKPQTIKKKIRITRQYQPTVPVMNIDPKLTRIVLQNLLSNAVKYTPAKGSIAVGLELADRAVRITVRDTGYGIPTSAQAKIFTKLFRADNVRAKDTDGTGLGLYIVKSIVEQSGGRTWFESVENRGTAFFVDLPLRGMMKKEGSKSLN